MLAEAPAAEAPATAEEMQQLIGDRARRRASRDGLEAPEPDGDAPHSKALGAFFALCTALSLGLAAVCVKLADCSVLWLMAARCVGDTTLSTASILLQRRCARDAGAPPLELWFFARDGARGLLARGVAYYAFLMTWYLSVDYLPLGDAIALNYSSPAVIVILCALVLGEPVPRYFALLFALIFAGVLLLAQPAGLFGGASGEPLSPLGVGFAAVSVGAIALVTVLTRLARRAHVLHVQQASGCVALALVPLSFGVAALCPGGVPRAPSAAQAPYVALVALLAFAGMACWKLANDYAKTAAEVQLVFMVEVPFGMFLQLAVFGERLDLLDWLGCGLILSSSALDVLLGAGYCGDCGAGAAPAPADGAEARAAEPKPRESPWALGLCSL